jgi:hypothetical protein
MSKQTKQIIECPQCGEKNNFLLWESINTDIDPNMKKILFDGFLWKHSCSKCNFEVLVNSALLYHNPEKRYMVQLEPIVRQKKH